MIIRLTQCVFAAFCKLAPGAAANTGYWLFRHPSAFNFKTPEEKLLLEKAETVRARAEEIFFSAASHRIRLLQWSDGKDDTRPAVLMLHGWGGEGELMLQFVDPLRALGYRVLVPDLPGQGKTGGKIVDTRVSAEAIVALGKRFGPVRAIIGHSMGALLACLTTAGHENFGGRLDARKLVLINGPKSVTSVIEGLGGAVGLAPTVINEVKRKAEADFGAPLEITDARSLLDAINLPVLAFHDRDDPFVAHATSIANLVSHAKLKAVHTNGLGHISILEDADVISEVMGFLEPSIEP